MIHWCAEETAAVVGVLGSVRLAWHWLKSKYRAWRLQRMEDKLYAELSEELIEDVNEKLIMDALKYGPPRTPQEATDMERALRALRGEKL